MKTAYDEVVKQPCDKLAQTMQDMTYCYNETVVPKKHYKKLLTKQLEEVVADKASAQELSALQMIASNITGNQAPLLNPDIKNAFEGAIKA